MIRIIDMFKLKKIMLILLALCDHFVLVIFCKTAVEIYGLNYLKIQLSLRSVWLMEKVAVRSFTLTS